MTTAIDVSLLPAPDAIKALSYADIKAARLASLKLRYAEAGLPWDVDGEETDPAVILQEEDAFREQLDKGAINDAVRAVLPATARRADLDNLVAIANVVRATLTAADPEAGTEAVMETDAALLRRYLTAFAAPAAGSAEAYLNRALTAAPELHDVAVVRGTEPGKVLVYLLGANGVTTPLARVLDVALALQAKDAKALTDDVSVLAAAIQRYDVSLTLRIPPGPSPTLIRDQVEQAVRATALARYRIGAEVPAAALVAAAYAPNVQRVDAPGLADRAGLRGVAHWLRTLTIATEVAE